jgi:plasmid stabilization system protein ParE
MRVHWTDRAKHRLRLIHDRIAPNAPLVAPQVIERLIHRSQLIGIAPYAGREVPEYTVRTCAKCSNAHTVSSTESSQIGSTSSPSCTTANCFRAILKSSSETHVGSGRILTLSAGEALSRKRRRKYLLQLNFYQFDLIGP